MNDTILMRMLSIELGRLNASKYTLEYLTATEAEIITLNPSQIAVTQVFEARVEDTDFEVGVTGDTESILYSEANCMFVGRTGWDGDVYRSFANIVLKGAVTISADGEPVPSFLLSYVKATIEEYAAD